AIGADPERHQVLAHDERAVIDRAHSGRQLLGTRTRELKVGTTVQRDVREYGLSRASLAQDASRHLWTCEIVIEVFDERGGSRLPIATEWIRRFTFFA